MNEPVQPHILHPEANSFPEDDVLDLGAFSVNLPNVNMLREQKIVGFDRRDVRSQSFKLLRTQLSKNMAKRKANLIGVTSVAPNAGKSFVALNLAAALAQTSERPVFLVDFDLRKGSLAGLLGIEIEHGVSDYLDGTIDDPSAIGLRVSETRLAVFPTRPIDDGSAELLASSRAQNLVSLLRNSAEGSPVLFDLPPVYASDDTMLASEQLDGFVMIVESGVNSKRQVQDAIAMLAPVPCIGVVLNKYQGTLLDHYGYGYNYAYRYARDDAEPAGS